MESKPPNYREWERYPAHIITSTGDWSSMKRAKEPPKSDIEMEWTGWVSYRNYPAIELVPRLCVCPTGVYSPDYGSIFYKCLACRKHTLRDYWRCMSCGSDFIKNFRTPAFCGLDPECWRCLNLNDDPMTDERHVLPCGHDSHYLPPRVIVPPPPEIDLSDYDVDEEFSL